MIKKAKKTVYLDTNVISYRFNYKEDDIESLYRHNITKDWWENESFNYELFISDMHLEEIYSYEFRNKKKIIKLIKGINILEINNKIRDISEIYLKKDIMPKYDPGDAFHLAIASYYKIDYLLTWNCKHLANVNKIEKIIILNSQLELFTPKIITPENLFSEEATNER